MAFQLIDLDRGESCGVFGSVAAARRGVTDNRLGAYAIDAGYRRDGNFHAVQRVESRDEVSVLDAAETAAMAAQYGPGVLWAGECA